MSSIRWGWRHRGMGRSHALLIILILARVGYGQAVVDQSHISSTWGYQGNVAGGRGSLPIDKAQTFTVGVSGKLSAFDVWVVKESVVTQPLVFDFRPTVAGAPIEADSGAEILASGEVPASLVPTRESGSLPFVLTHVELGDTAFDISAGDVLALALRSDDPGGQFNGVAYSWQARDDLYARGDSYQRHTSTVTWELPFGGPKDYFFRTYVVPVPEPSSLLFGVMAMGIWGVRRR
jgi:hypothetical protein